MNKYKATIRIKGQTLRTVVFAESPVHARLILEYQFGMNTVISGPFMVSESDTLKPVKPMTPDQYRLTAMKQQKDALSKSIKAERTRQRVKRAQQQIFKATH